MKKAGTSAGTIRKATAEAKARRVVREVSRGKSLSSALKSEGMSAKAFQGTEASGALKRVSLGNTYRYVPSRAVADVLHIVTQDGDVVALRWLPPDAWTVVEWRDAAYGAITYGRNSPSGKRLRAFEGRKAKDASGRVHYLTGDVDLILLRIHEADVPFEEFFQSQGEGRALRHAA
jgi:hypothetical protein